MYSIPVRLNTILAKKNILQYGRIFRTPASCYQICNSKENLHSLQGSHLQRNLPSLEGHHYERNDYGSAKWTHRLIIFSILLGSAAFGVVKAFCQKKNDELDEDNSFMVHKTNITIEEMRNLNLDGAKTLEEAKRKAVVLLSRKMQQVGAPGIAVSVSVDGSTVWARGFGFADVENYVPCSPKTVMRIASISKPLTMTLLAKLWEEGKVDLDAPVQKYVPYFPMKTVDGEEVTITTRQLISHKSGIRHYQLKETKKEEKKGESNKCHKIQTELKRKHKEEKPEHSSENKVQEDMGKVEVNKSPIQEIENSTEARKNSETSSEEKTECKIQSTSEIIKKKKMQLRQHLNRIAHKSKKKEKTEFDLEEYHLRERFTHIEDSVKIFMDDELFFKPGTGFLYTTHGWTLVSAVVEGVVNKPFTQAIQGLFHDLDLRFTYLEDPSKIIYNRASYYRRDSCGRLQNAPYVDNSYKWAGGGFLSTVEDLTRFGNAMLYSSQQDCMQNVEG
ncbi:serine beta-lactamase-like protein LACTB, mitochondrial isoform X2 [Palaemon carinicauda]